MARWGQNSAPAGATAVFGADQVPAVPTPVSYSRAGIFYLDDTGRQIDTATPGGHLSSVNLDERGNTVRMLTAGNREAALNASPTDTAEQEAALAQQLDSHQVYDAAGVLLLESFGPTRPVKIGAVVLAAREHTVNSYDQGAPAAGGPFRLLTTSTTGAWRDGQPDSQTRSTSTAYDWVLRLPVKVTTDAVAGGLNLSTLTGYDPVTGLVVSSSLPGAGGLATADPETTSTTYFSAAANASYPGCGSRPEWANLVCRVGPAGQIAGSALAKLPAKYLTYDRLNAVEVMTETDDTSTPATVLRTTTTSYDAAGRPVGSELSSSVPGVAVAASATVYDPATGLVVKTQAVSGGAVLSQVVRGFDSLGQQVSYTDSLGQQSTTSYDLLGRPSVSDDGKATQSRSYATEGPGSDPRGLLTSLTDSQAGTWLVGYDANGAATSVGYPGGLSALTTFDATGSPTALRYTLVGGSGCGSNCELYGEDVIDNVHGQQGLSSSLCVKVLGGLG